MEGRQIKVYEMEKNHHELSGITVLKTLLNTNLVAYLALFSNICFDSIHLY